MQTTMIEKESFQTSLKKIYKTFSLQDQNSYSFIHYSKPNTMLHFSFYLSIFIFLQ